MDNEQKKPSKIIESSKRNSMGIGASIATVITWLSTAFIGVPVPPEVAVAISGIVLMVISEIRDKD